jgi:ribosomal protein S8E
VGIGLASSSVSLAKEAPPTGREIMEKVVASRILDGSEAVIKMTMMNAKGEKRELKIAMATKRYDGGKTEKRIYRFLEPADVKGTGVLVYDYANKADDVWLFLPELRKTRRIVSSDRKKKFMGSEFSYGDLNTPALDEYNYKLLKEESYGGEPCWVIEVLPKSKGTAASEGYSKKIYWVSKDKSTVRKGVYYGPNDKPVKEFKASNVQQVGSKKQYRAMRMEMVNLTNGRRSVFASEKVTYAPGTKDDFFTTRYLERK